jgi:dihydrofolate reductase
MQKVTCDISMSVDGYVAGTDQRLDAPFGDGPGERLHRWMFEQREQNRAEIDGITAAGAYVMGRNMFSPGRGEWDLDWTGWWGGEPPFHAPVFVLTHHPREPLTLADTVITFVTDGAEAALALARQAAGDRDVAIAGGAATINQYLAAGQIDELRLHVVPLILGAGEQLFDGTVDVELEPISARGNELVSHLTYRVGH